METKPNAHMQEFNRLYKELRSLYCEVSCSAVRGLEKKNTLPFNTEKDAVCTCF
ncbi:MAG: hypothetical protein Q4C65_14870 [Eubacteriales bacterium]|nr:hypothetical protein [Eubacteriales bacterium]